MLLTGKTVFYSRSTRCDQFRHKRYTDSNVQRFRSIVIRAKVVGEKGGEVKLVPTAAIADVPNEFVVSKSDLVCSATSIRTLEADGDMLGCNVWKET
jgi:hypothetical protein